MLLAELDTSDHLLFELDVISVGFKAMAVGRTNDQKFTIDGILVKVPKASHFGSEIRFPGFIVAGKTIQISRPIAGRIGICDILGNEPLSCQSISAEPTRHFQNVQVEFQRDSP